MSAKRKVEYFSAGCTVCDQTLVLVRNILCASCELEIMDMGNETVAAKAKEYGIHSVPAVVVDGKLASCCMGRGVNESSLRDAGVGVSKA